MLQVYVRQLQHMAPRSELGSYLVLDVSGCLQAHTPHEDIQHMSSRAANLLQGYTNVMLTVLYTNVTKIGPANYTAAMHTLPTTANLHAGTFDT